MPVSTPEKGRPKNNSLVVCAGTVDIKNVSGMGSGFLMFKDIFGRKKVWDSELQKVLDAHFKPGLFGKPQPIPPYITLNSATADNNLLGGVATVPRMNQTIRSLSLGERNKIYEDAVRGAIVAVKNSQPQRPLFIQPLGIAAYGWDATEAAKSFAKVIQEEDPSGVLDISINIYDTSKGSKDMKFKDEFHKAMALTPSNAKLSAAADKGYQKTFDNMGSRATAGAMLAEFQGNMPGLVLEEKQGPLTTYQGIKGLNLVGDKAHAKIVCTDSKLAAQFEEFLNPGVKSTPSADSGRYKETLATDRSRTTLAGKLAAFQANMPGLVLEEKQGPLTTYQGIKGLNLVSDRDNAKIVCTDPSVKAKWDDFQAFMSAAVPEQNPEDCTSFLSSVIGLSFRYPAATAALAIGLLMTRVAEISLDMAAVVATGAAVATGAGMAAYKARYTSETDDSVDDSSKDTDFKS